MIRIIIAHPTSDNDVISDSTWLTLTPYPLDKRPKKILLLNFWLVSSQN